jgi:hypothetical protein
VVLIVKLARFVAELCWSVVTVCGSSSVSNRNDGLYVSYGTVTLNGTASTTGNAPNHIAP